MPGKLRTPLQSILALWILQTWCTALAQAPAQTGVIRTTSREVVVDVVIRDRHGHLVRDLDARDFEVYEDGVKQRITSFRNIQGQELAAAGAQAAQSQSKDSNQKNPASVLPNSVRETHIVTIVVGEVASTHLSFAHSALEQFLKEAVPPDTYVSILRTDHTLSVVQPFTNDKAALLRAAQRATMLHAENLQSAEALATSESSLTTATNVATGPGANPPIQPTVDISDPVTQRLGPLNTAQQTEATLAEGLRFASDYIGGMNTLDMLRELIRSQAHLQARKVVLYLADGLALPADRPDTFAGVISDANRAGVTFYTFDTKGLFVPDNPLMTPASQGAAQLNRAIAESKMTAALSNGSLQGRAAFNAMSAADDVILLSSANPELSMQELAVRTGGFATMNTNNLLDPMRRVTEDIGTHYELTYTPASGVDDGRFRTIEVKVDRPKVTIEARRGYFALPEINGEPLQPFELVALNAVNARPQPHEVSFEADLLRFRPSRETTECAVTLQVPIASLTPARNPKTGAYHVRVAFMALLQDGTGEVVRRISHEMVRDVPADQWPAAQRESIIYSEPVSLTPGRYTLSTAVVDNSSPGPSEHKQGAKRIAEFVAPAHDLSLSSVEIVQRVEALVRPADPRNPFEMEGKRLTFTLADTVPAGKPAPLYFVIYPAQQTNAAPQLFVQLFQNGKEVAQTSPEMPNPDPTGAIPVYAELSPPPGAYDVHVIVKQGDYIAQQTRSLTIQ